AVIAIWCVPSATLAGERVGDAALGALSGAVVLGPVGAVAGAVIGYTAGPSIADSWGFRRSEPRQSAKLPPKTTSKRFTPLKDGPLTADEIARAAGTDRAKTAPLLHALVAIGLLKSDGDCFLNSPEADQFLVRGSPDYIGMRHYAYRPVHNASNDERHPGESASIRKARSSRSRA